MSHEYEMALEQFRRCSAAFRAITQAYRARTIGDDEYLAARRDFGTATRLMDEAHDRELVWRDQQDLLEEMDVNPNYLQF